MSITHASALRNTLADAVDAAINAGSSDAQGDFVVKTSGDSVLAAIPLSDPAFGSASSGTITMADTPKSAAASGTGTAAKFSLRNKDNEDQVLGSVTATGGGGDVEIDNTSINSGQTVEVSSFTYSAPN